MKRKILLVQISSDNKNTIQNFESSLMRDKYAFENLFPNTQIHVVELHEGQNSVVITATVPN